MQVRSLSLPLDSGDNMTQHMSDLIMLFLEQRDLLGEALEFIEDYGSYSQQSQLELEERIRRSLEKDLSPSS